MTRRVGGIAVREARVGTLAVAWSRRRTPRRQAASGSGQPRWAQVAGSAAQSPHAATIETSGSRARWHSRGTSRYTRRVLHRDPKLARAPSSKDCMGQAILIAPVAIVSMWMK